MHEKLKRIDWRDLELFLDVAEAGSVRAGAVATRHTVATIRRRIGRIEDKLGERLANREPHGLVLTPLGHRLVATAREMRRLRQNLEADKDVAAGRDRVRIAVTEGLGTYWLMPRLVEFQNEYPDLDITLTCDMQRSDVAGGECDVAIQLVAPENETAVAERIASLHLMAFASEGYLSQAGIPQSVDDWPRHRLVWQEADQVASDLLPFVLGKSATDGLIVLRTNTSSAHFRAIASGGGIGVLPTYARAISRRVVPLDIGINLRREIFCVTSSNGLDRPGVQLAVAWLRACFDGARYPWFNERFIHPCKIDDILSSSNVVRLFEGFIDPPDLEEG